MEQLKQLNAFRLDAETNFDELQQIRENHMLTIGRIDLKLDDYYNLLTGIRAELMILFINEESALQIDILNVHNDRDQIILFAKINIFGFPPIYKTFSPISYLMYDITRNDLMGDFVKQGRIKEMVIDWLRNHEDWSGLFDQRFSVAAQVIERFVDDDAVSHFFKRRPFFI